jgi:2-polyprenyl-6-methoxyphenol hydroxylase-like FAD-dependent oxidoreductase
MSQPRSTYDAVVVGARCAGAATALLLARRGLRVLVVDRARRGSDTLSTHALMRPAVVQLHRWGLLDDVVAAGTPAVRRTVFHYGTEQVAVTLRPAAGTDALYAPRRTVLDAILLDAAERAGAEVRTGVRVRSLLHDADGRVAGVRIEDGGRTRSVRAGLTVGADGVRSLVAEHAGARIERQGRHAVALSYGYFDALPSDGYEWFYGAGTTAGLIPTNGDQSLAFVARPALAEGHAVPPGLDGFRAVLAEAWPEGLRRLDAAHLSSPLRQFRGLPSQRRAAWGRGWVLVGDAGYYLDPMSTHGISQALRDAELLADAVTAPLPRDAALHGYQQQRDAVSEPLFDAVERIASFAWDLHEVRTLLMALTSVVSDEVDLLTSLDAPPRGAAVVLSA